MTISIFMPVVSSVPLSPNQPPYILNFSFSPNPASIGESVSFHGSAKDPENGTIYVDWSFGDGDTATSQGTGWPYSFSKSHTYASTGTFSVALTVTDMGGKTDTESGSITITNDAPNTPSTPSGPTSLNVGESGSFSTSTTDSDGHQVQYRFDWDDGVSGWTSLGSSGHSDSMSHSWSSAGTYSVKAQAKDEYGLESGWSSGLSVTVIEPNDPPVANAGGPYSGYVGDSISMSASGSTDSDGSVVGYRWDYTNDGSWDTSWSSSPSTSHSYSSAESCTVKVQVKDDDDATDTDTASVTISEVPNQPPVANAGGPYSARTNIAINFDASGSTDLDGSVVGYRWDWTNDGSWDTDWSGSSTTSHSYSVAGTYTVKVEVKDDDDATDADTASVSITRPNQKPTVSITYPEYGSTVSGVVTIQGTAHDSDGSINKVEVEINDEGWVEAEGKTSWSYDWDTESYENGEYEIRARSYDGSKYSDISIVTVNLDNNPEEADLDCEGSLSWTDVTPGATVEGDFTIKNICHVESYLEWEIEVISDWSDDGDWTFTYVGDSIIPADGELEIHASIAAPNEEEQEFSGQIKVINKDNPEDYDIVPISLTTPKTKIKNLLLMRIAEIFQHMLEIIERILNLV